MFFHENKGFPFKLSKISVWSKISEFLIYAWILGFFIRFVHDYSYLLYWNVKNFQIFVFLQKKCRHLKTIILFIILILFYSFLIKIRISYVDYTRFKQVFHSAEYLGRSRISSSIIPSKFFCLQKKSDRMIEEIISPRTEH